MTLAPAAPGDPRDTRAPSLTRVTLPPWRRAAGCRKVPRIAMDNACSMWIMRVCRLARHAGQSRLTEFVDLHSNHERLLMSAVQRHGVCT